LVAVATIVLMGILVPMAQSGLATRAIAGSGSTGSSSHRISHGSTNPPSHRTSPGASAHARMTASHKTQSKPSIVLILTDDQRWDTLSWMPAVESLLVAHGVTFTNAFVPNSLCCPSRTSILTGEYSNKTGVWSNDAPYGGFTAFHQDHSTIATWLHADGYRTALVGKYLNDYDTAAHQGYVPPGWDRWFAVTHNGSYFDYDVSVDGKIVHHGNTPSNYSTDVLTDQAVSFIDGASGPLFLYFAPTAPHDPFIPAPQDAKVCRDLPPFDPPSLGASNAGRPRYLRALPWSRAIAAHDAWVRTAQCRTLVDVNRSVVRIVNALQATGRLSNTMIVFMSDNGYQWGEHRLGGKSVPYEESIRVPMVIRYDPLTTTARTDPRMALNIDLAPTFAALAGVAAPRAQGRSLLPLLSSRPVHWRTSFLIEHGHGTEESPAVPDYCGIRTERWKYVLYSTGARELYDLRADPYELTNLANRPAFAMRVRAMRADLLARCRPLPPAFR
jgi:arylsulfatase A-like enzyme